MTRRALAALPLPQEAPFVHLHGKKWADYEALLAMRGDHAVPRITYLEGTIEIMSPSRNHELIKSLMGRLVEAYCDERGIDFTTVGSWTLKRRKEERGAEPDECYIFGPISGRRAPDLAIEIEWTSGRIDKLEVYRKLGVREVWYWRRNVIQVFVLRAERYVRAAKSHALPKLDLLQLARFAARHGTTRQVVRAYRKALKR